MSARPFLAFVFTLLVLLAIGAGGLFYAQQELNGPSPLAQNKNVVVPRGASASKIAALLEKEGVIKNHFFFRLNYMLDGEPDLKSGEYAFAPGMTMPTMIAKMAKGDVVIRNFTVAEGLTSADIVRALNAETALTGDVKTLPPEGSLLPETYRYSFGDDRNKLIERMQKAMKDALAAAWDMRDADVPLADAQQLLTLASVVEKETGLVAERPRVAGVFINRLRKKMPLQSDPTVTYGITLGQQPLGRSLTYADLQKASAYNTYTIPALPIGPICNPGKAALMAVAKPEKNDFIFFVADGTGGHRFAATEAEHLKNVANWRKVNSK